MVALGACQDPGSFSVRFEWPEPPRFERAPSAFGRVEHRPGDPTRAGAILASFGPVPLDLEGRARLEVPLVTYGEARVVVLEVRESESPDSQVLAYGLSAPFALAPGLDVEVPVLLEPRPPPADGRLAVLGAPWGFVPGPGIRLALSSTVAARVRLSNLVGLPEAWTRGFDWSALPIDASGARVVDWDLDLGLEPCGARSFCPRTVYARFVDAVGYASVPVSADVVIDARPPGVVADATVVEPAVARGDSRVVVNLTLDEPVDPAPELELVEAPGFGFERVFPAEAVPPPGNVFTFVAREDAGRLGADGEFTLRTTLRDRAGNSSPELMVGRFRLDAPAPRIGGLEVAPARLDATIGRTLTVRFTVNEDLEQGRVEVTVGGLPMDACARTPRAEDVALVCTRATRGDEIAEGSEQVRSVLVQATDPAGNVSRASSSVVYDFRPPGVVEASVSPRVARGGVQSFLTVTTDERLAEPPRLVWAGVDPGFVFFDQAGTSYAYRRSVDASLSDGSYRLTAATLVDLAGNTATATLAVELEVDATAPSLSPIRVTPAVAAAGTAVTIEFELGEPRAALAALEVSLAGRAVEACTETASTAATGPASGAGVQLACTWPVRGDELTSGSEGVVPVLVEALDRAGNVVRRSANLGVDLRAPALLTAELAPPIVRDGQTVILSLGLDEALGPGLQPGLTWAGGRDPGLSLVRSTGLSWTWSRLADAGLADGAYALESVALEDAAGNRRTVATASVTLQVDRTVPVLTGLSLAQTRYRVGERVQLGFRMSEVATRREVTLGGRPMSCLESGRAPSIGVTCQRTLDGTEAPRGAETTIAARIEVEDAAGNVAVAEQSLILDDRAPGLASYSMTPEHVRAGVAIELVIESDEPVAQPVLRWNGPDPQLAWVGAVGLRHRFRRVVAAGAPTDGRYELAAVSLVDRAGNVAEHPAPLRTHVDTVVPVILAPTVEPGLGIGATGSVTVAFALAEHSDPLTLDVSISGQPVPCVVSGRGPPLWTLRCARPMQASDDDGQTTSRPVLVTVSDRAGNVAQWQSTVRFDFEPPDVLSGTASVFVQAPRGSLLERLVRARPELTPTAATVGSVLRLSFTVTEALRELPRVRALGGALPMQLLGASGDGTFAFTATVPAAGLPADGRHDFRVELVDKVGNRATRTAAALRLDATAPPAPVVARTVAGADGPIQVSHWPWGGRETGGARRFELRAEAGAVAPGALLVALGGSDPTHDPVLGVGRADASGALGTIEIEDPGSSLRTWVAAVDDAGNLDTVSRSPAGPRPVERNRWIASLGQPPGSPPNPHLASAVRSFRPSRNQIPADVRPLTAAERAATVLDDGATVRVETEARWERIVARSRSVGPSVRVDGAMAYDPFRDQLMLFGGFDSSRGVRHGDTWTGDGLEWRQWAGGGAIPSRRNGAAMAPDRNGRMVMFGGFDGVSSLGDTWLFDGTEWTQTATAGVRPAPRFHHAMAYLGGVTYLVGGGRDELWAWDGARWSGPMPAPPSLGRVSGCLIADPSRGRLVLFGAGQLHEWTPSTGWAPIPNSLLISDNGLLIHDRERDRLVYVGGRTFGGRIPTMLTFDGTAWVAGPTTLGAREFTHGAYLPQLDRVLVFGGLAGPGSGAAADDVWLWDGERWLDATPTSEWPGPRRGLGLAYDPVAREVVMFGGETLIGSVQPIREVWTWNGYRWRQRSPTVWPRGLVDMAMASGIGTRGPMVFGGSDNGVPTDELFEWRGDIGDFVQIPRSNPWPAARAEAAIATLTTRSAWLMLGGSASDMRGWILDGAVWSPASAAGGPTALRRHSLVGFGTLAYVDGGFDGTSDVADRWAFSVNGWRSVSALPSRSAGHVTVQDVERGLFVVHVGVDAIRGSPESGAWQSIAGASGLAPRMRGAATFDASSDSNIILGGAANEDIWLQRGIAELRPALVTSFDLSAFADVGLSVLGATLRTSALGSAQPPSRPRCNSSRGPAAPAWVAFDASRATVRCLPAVQAGRDTIATLDHGDARAVLDAQSVLTVALTTVGESTHLRARVTTDSMELELEFAPSGGPQRP